MTRCPRSRALAVGFATLFPALVASTSSSRVGARERSATITVSRSGAGRPLIFIPGLGSSGTVWGSTVARFRKQYECHVVEIAGFAGNERVPSTPFLEAVRDDLLRYVRDQHLDRPVVVGHSLGGVVGLWAAATAPETFSAAVTVDGVPFLPGLRDPTATAASLQPQAESLRRFYLSMTVEQRAAAAQASAAGMVRSTADVERIARWMSRSDRATVAQALYEVMSTDLRATVSAIGVPTLVVAAGHGVDEDEAKTRLVASYESQVRAIPRHQVVLAERARHFVMLDDPDFLGAAMEHFLAGQDAATAAGWGR
jgi:N-formylmaleamate deformylase